MTTQTQSSFLFDTSLLDIPEPNKPTIPGDWTVLDPFAGIGRYMRSRQIPGGLSSSPSGPRCIPGP
jgi:hypothetical protein